MLAPGTPEMKRMRLQTKEKGSKVEQKAWRRLLAQKEQVQKIKEVSATNKWNLKKQRKQTVGKGNKVNVQR